ncbi:Major Facilitator Superfamily, putative [Angomonas deanei]|uniref:Major Facilitator Superfamily, putative n=1 Tax=Angomonas deanei TaxID=59799 RepID=A0A7G2CVX4_9TRYP|nr:Major Facilitator Superfamily, putative [Angomonas deanei]
MSTLYKKFRSINQKPADHWLGYAVAISGALMQMMTYGIDNSFSTFSNSMQTDPTLGFPSATSVSFGNSVSLGLSPVFGVFAGFLVDRVPPRLMMLISTVLLFAGCWLSSSFANSSVEVTFSYCLLASISSAFMLSPGAAATGSWFQKRIGLAQGINFSGGGIGSAWIAPILGKWVEMYGWRKTFRLMSSFCAIGLFASIFSCRRHPVPTEESNEPNADETGEAEEVCAGKVDETEKAGFFMKKDRLFHAIHTRRLRPKEYLRAFLTVEFLSNFFMFAIFGWAFYGLIYVIVPYVSSMGAEGTVYANVTAISTSKASTIFTFWGVFQIVGSILVGSIASFTADEFAYCACCALGAFSSALLIFCRDYAAFAATCSIVGFCTAGIFAVMPALIAKNFYGPNLGFFMGCVFVAGTLGGFSAPPIQAQLQVKYNGNYSFGCVFISCSMTVPGLICYITLWKNKQNFIARFFRKRLGSVSSLG